MFIFGIGGGSDYFSSQLIRTILNPQCCTVFTSLAAIYTDGAVDLELTIDKYSSRSEFTVCDKWHDWPLFRDSRSSDAYGLIIPRANDSASFAKITRLFTDTFLASSKGRECIAVDTGGDSLRCLIPGMGEHDISNLFDNGRDERDSVSLNLIYSIFKTSVPLYVIGPGSDGETLNQDLTNAIQGLRSNVYKSVHLLHEGSLKEFSQLLINVPGWSDPIPGSTISNIINALNSCDKTIEVMRRGVAVLSVSNTHLQSYWKVTVEPSLFLI